MSTSTHNGSRKTVAKRRMRRQKDNGVYERDLILNDDIHRDLYEKVNANTKVCAEMTASLGLMTAQNERFIEMIEYDNRHLTNLFRWVSGLLFVMLLFTTAAIIYGAIGEKGLRSVRENMPKMPAINQTADIIPWTNDLDGWQSTHSQHQAA